MKNVARTHVRVPKNRRDIGERKARAPKSRRRLAIFLLLAVAATTIAFAAVSSAKITKNPSRNGPTKSTKRKGSTDELEKLFQSPAENDQESAQTVQATAGVPVFASKPKELHLTKSGRQFNGDLRNLPKDKPVDMERPEREGPEEPPLFYVPPKGTTPLAPASQPKLLPAAPAPTPLSAFDGLGRPPGNGFPPDTNGDVGPTHYIQTINTSIGIYNKGTGLPITSFSFNTFMSQGAFGNLCDTNNFGDPVVVYDTFEDRWIITDFAFTLDGSNNVINPPGSFQCFAVSKTSDPVLGGWNFYSIQITDALNDYPKFGIWPDGLYMTANMFGFGGLSGGFVFSREWAFNKAQMYAGAASPQIVSIDAPRVDINGGSVFTAIPSNARLQVGTPPAGTPNYFAVTGTYTNALQIWKFHVDWGNVYASSFTGPFIPLTGAAWIGPPASVPSQGGNNLDTLATRAMMQNQYTNLGGAESIWLTHTVRNSTTVGVSAVRWYELSVTGGTVAANTTQAAFHEPDTTNRFMPSVAVDRAGDMMVGYSASSAAMKPAIRYAGRLPGDPLSTLPQTEVDLIQGLGTQVGNCGGAPCTRWGDYSAMSLDPNGCTFWFTSEYYPADGLFYATRIGSFAFPSCTPIGNGTLQGTVTTNPGGTPISGATIAFGSRTATTNGSGFYSFINIPAGTYPSITASSPGSNSSTAAPVVIPNGGTTVQDFALTAAAASACLTDTSQADFSLGTPTAVDLVTTPGDAVILNKNLDQINEAIGGNGVGINFSPGTWGGQTFTPAVTGLLTRADINLFCSGCTGTIPTLTLSVRATAANVPTGADIASTTLAGFSSGAAIFYTGTFSTPAALTAGTKYALIIRPTANPSLGTYALTRSGSAATGQSVYANGDRVSSVDSGGTWTINTTGGIVTDCGFRTFMSTLAGNFVSAPKDSNPVSPLFTRWNSLLWTATVPANTTLQFQIAGSNNAAGPFNFIGPDGTAATFFTTSPATIFNLVNGNRYLKYKAYLTTTDGAVTPTVNDVTVCFNTGPTAADGIVSGRITDQNGGAVAGVVVNLSGTQNRKFITDASGNYRFDNVETNGFYTVRPARANYSFSPAERSFSQIGNRTEATFTGTPVSGLGNPLDTPEYFVRAHYLDFLGREPDESGFNFWSDQILSCGSDAACVERRTINVSAAYFLSIEFGQTGRWVDGLYRASYGRRPLFEEFMPDTAIVAHDLVVGRAGWPDLLEANKQAFIDAWVQRAAFRTAYDGLPNDRFVDELISHTRVSFTASERDALVSSLSSGELTRAAVLRRIVEDERFVTAKRNEAFVMMQYFGYLRRDPDESGYQFWLNKLNQFGGNFEQAEMVKAFLVSGEYRGRFRLN